MPNNRVTEHVSTAFGRGGRDGEIWSNSGSFHLATAMPGSRRKGATPEELIAGAWSACFGTTLEGIARARGIDASDATIKAEISLRADLARQSYAITRAVLTVSVEEGRAEALDAVLDVAHRACPVSKLFAAGVEGTAVVQIERAPSPGPPRSSVGA